MLEGIGSYALPFYASPGFSQARIFQRLSIVSLSTLLSQPAGPTMRVERESELETLFWSSEFSESYHSTTSILLLEFFEL